MDHFAGEVMGLLEFSTRKDWTGSGGGEYNRELKKQWDGSEALLK